jgi:hypothetical protein
MKQNLFAMLTVTVLAASTLVSCGKKKADGTPPQPQAQVPRNYPNTYSGGSNYSNQMPMMVEIYRNQIRCYNDRNVEVNCGSQNGQMPQSNPQCVFERLYFNGSTYNSGGCIQ